MVDPSGSFTATSSIVIESEDDARSGATSCCSVSSSSGACSFVVGRSTWTRSMDPLGSRIRSTMDEAGAAGAVASSNVDAESPSVALFSS